MLDPDLLESFQAAIRNRQHLGVRKFDVGSDLVRPPIAVPDHPDFQRGHRQSAPLIDSTTGTVRRRTFRSNHKDWRARYSMSRRSMSSKPCLLYTSPSPRDGLLSRMPS